MGISVLSHFFILLSHLKSLYSIQVLFFTLSWKSHQNFSKLNQKISHTKKTDNHIHFITLIKIKIHNYIFVKFWKKNWMNFKRVSKKNMIITLFYFLIIDEMNVIISFLVWLIFWFNLLKFWCDFHESVKKSTYVL